MNQVILAAGATPTYGTLTLECSITVDGIRQSNRGDYNRCELVVSFPQLRPELDAARSQPPTAASSPATSTTAGQPLNAGEDACRLVTREEVDAVATTAGRGKQLNPTRFPTVVAGRCQWTFVGQGTVTYWFTPGGQARTVSSVPELGVPASWLSLGEFTVLEAQVSGGVLRVDTAFGTEAMYVNERALAVGFAKATLPRLS